MLTIVLVALACRTSDAGVVVCAPPRADARSECAAVLLVGYPTPPDYAEDLLQPIWRRGPEWTDCTRHEREA